MPSLDYVNWKLASKKQRWEELREVLAVPWVGDRGWEGRTIGMHLPLNLRSYAVHVQERLQMRSMKEVLFKALVIGLRELGTMPEVDPARPNPMPQHVNYGFGLDSTIHQG